MKMFKNGNIIFNPKTGKHELTLDLLRERGWTDDLIQTYVGYKKIYDLNQVKKIEERIMGLKENN